MEVAAEMAPFVDFRFLVGSLVGYSLVSSFVTILLVILGYY